MPKNARATAPKSDALANRGADIDLAEVNSIMDLVPDVDEDPTPRMAAAIMAAGDPEDWASVFEGQSIKDNAGKKIRVTAIRKAPSSYDGPIKQFLVADVIYLDSGEAGVLSISSVISMIQLLVAHQRQWLPLDFEIVQKDKPTRKGFFPIHLKVLPRPKTVRQAS